ncbi:hypothetical protein J6590_039631 [Homalodisca vitripennis]|nr:hypothetical protein J6590_039631 [Homalodisca vitripennis]
MIRYSAVTVQSNLCSTAALPDQAPKELASNETLRKPHRQSKPTSVPETKRGHSQYPSDYVVTAKHLAHPFPPDIGEAHQISVSLYVDKCRPR